MCENLKTPIWDVHHHWVNEADYIGRLLSEMDRLGIERTGLVAMGDLIPDLFVSHGERVGCVDETDLARLVEERPDRFWGWGFVRLGHHSPERVDRLADMGMAGLKLHVPAKPYGHPEYFPLFEKARDHGLPCLFHTGIFCPPGPMPGEGIRSENCRPIHLEPIAHEFPDLKMIMAHLGVCWTEEAAALCRMFPNIYADLSGRSEGWRSGKSIEWFSRTFYWSAAHQKVIFGSDVHADELEDSLRHQLGILRGMGWDENQIEDVLYNNARRILGIS